MSKILCKKVMPFVIVFLLCFFATPAFAAETGTLVSSISPHAEGVCAPNTAVVLVDNPEDAEPGEEAEEQEPEEDEPSEAPEEIGEGEELTVAEMARANRDPDSDVWYNIEDEDCPGHEWEYLYNDPDGSCRVCLNCGCTEPVEALEEDVDCDGNAELECESGFNVEDEAVVNAEMEEE